MIPILLFCSSLAIPYQFTGLNATFNFGTASSPFSDITLTDNNLCLGYTVLVESSQYYVQATSSNGTGTTFQMVNSSNSAYKLNYSVSWAGTASDSPSFVSLSSGQNSSSTFPAQLLGILTCLTGLTPNATIQLKLLNSDQILAKEGTYTDTLTVLIIPS